MPTQKRKVQKVRRRRRRTHQYNLRSQPSSSDSDSVVFVSASKRKRDVIAAQQQILTRMQEHIMSAVKNNSLLYTSNTGSQTDNQICECDRLDCPNHINASTSRDTQTDQNNIHIRDSNTICTLYENRTPINYDGSIGGSDQEDEQRNPKKQTPTTTTTACFNESQSPSTNDEEIPTNTIAEIIATPSLTSLGATYIGSPQRGRPTSHGNSPVRRSGHSNRSSPIRSSPTPISIASPAPISIASPIRSPALGNSPQRSILAATASPVDGMDPDHDISDEFLNQSPEDEHGTGDGNHHDVVQVEIIDLGDMSLSEYFRNLQ